MQNARIVREPCIEPLIYIACRCGHAMVYMDRPSVETYDEIEIAWPQTPVSRCCCGNVVILARCRQGGKLSVATGASRGRAAAREFARHRGAAHDAMAFRAAGAAFRCRQ